MSEKRGFINLVKKQEYSTRFLFVIGPGFYPILSTSIPEECGVAVAPTPIQGEKMVSNNKYLAVITEEGSVARKAAEKGIPFILIKDNPNRIHQDLAKRNPGSYCLDTNKNEFINNYNLSIKEILNLYKQPTSETQEKQTSSKKYKILIVEDEPTNLLLLQQTFEDEDYEVITADNRDDGIAKIQEGGLDAIITDYELPDSPSGGLHILQVAQLEYPNTPVIVHTAQKNTNMKNVGAYEVVIKSGSSPQELVDLVKNALQEYHTTIEVDNQGALSDLKTEKEPEKSITKKFLFKFD
ncbi:response regulator [Candidatus Woesearchaeota archaeon]|nr:response regulator [Candidatus Woesearchaeota archaeon]